MERNEEYLRDFVCDRSEVRDFNYECDEIADKAH